MSVLRKMTVGGLVLAVAGAMAWALWPEPMAVDLAPVTRGPMQGTLTAEGVTRVREPYAITAPITGTALRAPVVPGDSVTAGETVVAVIRPADPALMDARSRAQAEAAVTEAEAAVRLAQTNLEAARADLVYAESQLDRGRALAERGTIPGRMVEELEAAHVTARQRVAAAISELDLNRATLARMQAQLVSPGDLSGDGAPPGDCCVQIRAPASGTVLTLSDPSARLVQAGTLLLTIGDLAELEIEVDLLSTDAVAVRPGMSALVERWGGDGVLEARVRRVEPAAFTRVSALGIEEQRVRMLLDLLAPPEDRPGLGERFRVHVRLILWEADDIAQLPQAALFRHQGGWAVYRLDEDGRARLTPVVIGRQAGTRAEVLEGISPGAMVVLFPPASLTDGSPVRRRDG